MNKPWKILTSFAPPTKRRLLRRSRNARLLAQALAVVALCAAAEAVRADDVPAFGNWEHYHFSLDPTPIEVRFVHDRGSRDFPALKIPRSYVVYANGAEPSTKGPLPALVETNNVQIAFADPDGKAWSVAIDAHAKEIRRHRADAAIALRPHLYIVALSPNTNPNIIEDIRRHFRGPHRAEPFEGLDASRHGGGTGIYYAGTGNDLFISAQCYEPRNPAYLCQFYFMVTPNIAGTVKFSDFRVYGGRDYANRRVRFARDAVCRFLEQC